MATTETTASEKRTEKKLWLVTSLCVLGLFGFVGLWQRQHADPVVDIPTPTMPNPNAWDFYVKASQAVIVTKQMTDALYSRPERSKVLSLREKEALLQPNALALKTVRQGFAYPCVHPVTRGSISFPSYAGFRNLARLMSFEGQVRAERGDFAGAANSHIDTIRMGSDIPRGGPLIAMLVGVAMEAIGRKPMWTVIDKMDAQEARAAVKRLEAIESKQQPYADTLREEKYGFQTVLLQMFRGSTWRRELLGLGRTSAMDRARTVILSKRTIFNNYSSFMDALIIEARKPYRQRQEPPIPNDAFSKMILPSYGRSAFSVARSQTGNQLLIASLALRAYFVEHNSYPATLQELAPKYFKSVPDDPFAIKSPLRYKKQGAKYVLWSIGPDGVDNSGRPTVLAAPIKTNPPSYTVNNKSRGDFVAGINH